MQNLSVKRRATSILLVLAMLVVAVAVLLPVTTSADEPKAEIDDFGVQVLSDADVEDSEYTSLRFVCTIGNLAYSKVGFVISKSVTNPTYKAPKCYTYETTTVYSKIIADDNEEFAGTNRWWVAVKLTGIPHSYFDGPLYVRAYVMDTDGGIRYSDVKSTTVCQQLDHTSHSAMPWDAEGTATLQTAGYLTWTCTECGLQLTQFVDKRTPIVYDSKNAGGPFKDNSNFTITKSIGAIRGNKSFAPTTEDPDGNDLWFEYSFLWNDSLYYRDRPQNLAEIRLFGFRCNRGISGEKYRGFYYMYLRDNNDGFKTSGDCPFKGHIDYSTYNTEYDEGKEYECADDLSGLNNKLFGDSVTRYKAGWAVARTSSPYIYDNNNGTIKGGNGWHRLGFRYHQEVESVSGSTVTYAGYTELYINGVLVWRVHTDYSAGEKSLVSNNVMPWEARTTAATGYTAGPNNLYYKNNDAVEVEMMVDSVTESSKSVFLAVGDVYWTCGDGFVMPVAMNNTPANTQTITLDKDYTLGYFYTDVGKTTVYDSKHPAGQYADGNDFAVKKSIGAIRGDNKSFAPTTEDPDGNDLWFEYSFLWNDTLKNYEANPSQIRLFGFRNNTAVRGFYYLMLPYKQTTDCPYAGHIDYSTYKTTGYATGKEYECADNLEPLGNKLNGDLIGQYVAGWGSNPKQRSYSPYLWDSENQTTCGWHRLGFRYHQEVASVSGSTVTYSGYTELYIDGVLCWRVHTNYKADHDESLVYNGVMPWEARTTAATGYTAGPNSLYYKNNDSVQVEMRVDNVKNSPQSVFLAVKDVDWTCGDGFVMPVSRNDTPVTRNTTLDKDYDKYYYTEIRNTDTTVYESYTTSDVVHMGDYKTLTEIRGDDHFYPDTSNGGAGCNLYFEYDFLWNDTLHNWNRPESQAEFKVITVQKSAVHFAESDYHREFYYLYLLDDDGKGGAFHTSNDCPYAGHFDYSTYSGTDATCATDLSEEGYSLFGDSIGLYIAGWTGGKGRSDSPYIYDEDSPAKGGAGWHRIGVLVHQEMEKKDGKAVYSDNCWTELFINGVKVWHVKTNMGMLNSMGLTLFTGTVDNGVIKYSDAGDEVRVGYQFNGFQGTVNTAYAVFANVNWRIVDVDFDPASEIEPVNTPAEAYFTIPNGPIVSGRIFYHKK